MVIGDFFSVFQLTYIKIELKMSFEFIKFTGISYLFVATYKRGISYGMTR